MTRRPAPPAQKALWGRQEPLPAPSKATPAATNDPELVASVVRAALTRGYVVIGHTQRVFLRDPGGMQKGGPVEPVPGYEQDTVRQLLDSGHLTTGGTHIVRYAGREGAANSILVPKATRAMITRWTSLRPLHGRTHPAGTGGSGVVTASLWCPECGEPATARPPTRWTDANGPRPGHSHRDGEPLCPVMTAQGYRPAQPTTARPA